MWLLKKNKKNKTDNRFICFCQKPKIHNPSRAHECAVIVIILNNKGSRLIPIRHVLQLHAWMVCVCVRASMCMSILPSKLSDGHAAQTLESAQNGCAAVQETGGAVRDCFIHPKGGREIKNQTHPAASASSWRCPGVWEKPCCPVAAWLKGWTDWCWQREEPSQLSCTGHPLCPSPSSSSRPACSSLTPSLCRSKLAAGPGPIESQVSCRDKTLDCPIEVTFPSVVCERQIARHVGIAANFIKKTINSRATVLLLFGLLLTLNLLTRNPPKQFLNHLSNLLTYTQLVLSFKNVVRKQCE